MNYRIVTSIVGRVLAIEAVLLLLPMTAAAVYGESVMPFVWSIAITAAAAALLCTFRPKTGKFYAREGFVSVALSWITISIFGTLPFLLSGEIPDFIDALFEIISGFTTTGSSIVPDVEKLSRGILFWRSFSHWIGGMGVLVFMMAVLPMNEEYSMHLLRAEVPGPVKGKLVPKMRGTARILYLIYIGLTVLLIFLLICGGMPVFDSIVHAFGTAGTGGFSIKTTSIGWYHSAYIDIVVSVFMVLFGINFNLYYMMLIRRSLKAFFSEELWFYLGIVAFATVTIGLNISSQYPSFSQSLRYSFFQVSSIITTTGYATADFNRWPEYSRTVLVALMFIGACAGSTGGGIKVSRFVLAIKSASCEILHQMFPRSVSRVTLDGERVDERTMHATVVFFILYILIIFIACILLSLEGLDFETTFTSVVTCLSNVGPGLSLVGPTGNFCIWSGGSKLVLCLCMLLGRLEIYPVIMLFSPGIWKKGGR